MLRSLAGPVTEPGERAQCNARGVQVPDRGLRGRELALLPAAEA